MAPAVFHASSPPAVAAGLLRARPASAKTAGSTPAPASRPGPAVATASPKASHRYAGQGRSLPTKLRPSVAPTNTAGKAEKASAAATRHQPSTLVLATRPLRSSAATPSAPAASASRVTISTAPKAKVDWFSTRAKACVRSTCAAKEARPESRASVRSRAAGGGAAGGGLAAGASGAGRGGRARLASHAPPPASASRPTPRPWPAATPMRSGSTKVASAVPSAAPAVFAP